MESSSSSTNRRKILGAVLTATVLVVVGVVALNNGAPEAHLMPLEHAAAIAQAEHAKTPLSQLPDESAVQTPEGWVIESDKPVESEGSDNGEEVSTDDDLEQDAVEEDEDIDSPLQIEEDAHGEKFVAELDSDVIAEDSEPKDEDKQVAADGQGYRRGRCYKNVKACGAKKACYRKCNKKCYPYAVRYCKPKKFCRCFCKYYGKYKRARKCVIYRRNMCMKGLQYRCKRRCKKFCKKVPQCYCCPKTHIRKKCRKMCRRYMYRSKCAKCRCYKVRCYKTCRFLCLYKY